jgi:hypothetical protein
MFLALAIGTTFVIGTALVVYYNHNTYSRA